MRGLLTLAIMSLAASSAHGLVGIGADSLLTRGLPTGVDKHGRLYMLAGRDTIHIDYLPNMHMPGALTEGDYRAVAEELGVEVAAIKAVVEIETGRSHEGFSDDGRPLINFDLNVFRQMAARNGVKLGNYARSHSEVFSRPNIRKYGSIQAAEHALLERAYDIDSLSAIEGTFWGMFQIGGFNWKKCGAESPEQFVELMSRSERDQLELFAHFISNNGLLKHLKAKNWSAFARGYNGPGYAANGYHTRLARAYDKYRRQAG